MPMTRSFTALDGGMSPAATAAHKTEEALLDVPEEPGGLGPTEITSSQALVSWVKAAAIRAQELPACNSAILLWELLPSLTSRFSRGERTWRERGVLVVFVWNASGCVKKSDILIYEATTPQRRGALLRGFPSRSKHEILFSECLKVGSALGVPGFTPPYCM